MAKAVSPVRLQQDLMEAAAIAAERMHRSAAEQVEYWASIGRSVSKVLDPDSLLEITVGLATLKVEPIEAPALKTEDVFASLEHDRESGALITSVTSSSVRYQASTAHPGQLEQLSPDGQVTVGQFRDGAFTPMEG